MISLVMLSGGIDSTYVLARLLKDSDDEVLAHHVHFINNSRRHVAESEACKKIVKYCQENYRPFSYTETAIDHRKLSAHGSDVAASGFEAGAVAASYFLTKSESVDRWLIGLTEEDTLPRWRMRDAQACCDANCQNGLVPELHFFPLVSLPQQVAYMGDELFEMTWSCRAPRFDGDNFSSCQECPACVRRAGGRAKAEAGITQEQLKQPPRPWNRIREVTQPRPRQLRQG